MGKKRRKKFCFAIEYPVYQKANWYPNWPLINRASRRWHEFKIGKLRIAIGSVRLP